jgi:hypothetical protein
MTSMTAPESKAARFAELQAEHDELRRDLDELTAEGKRSYPNGFTGNGCPGDYESWEADWADADRDLRDWLAGDDGLEFIALRAELHAGAQP